jgi:hypothetical protein
VVSAVNEGYTKARDVRIEAVPVSQGFIHGRALYGKVDHEVWL